MSDANLQTVEELIQRIENELGTTFSWSLFLAQVAYLRCKPIRIEEVSLPLHITGACFSFEDMDVIVVRAGLNTQRSLMTRLHECAHLLLGHAPHMPILYATFISQPTSTIPLYRTSAYDPPYEFVAETLATMLFARIHRWQETQAERVVQTLIDTWESVKN